MLHGSTENKEIEIYNKIVITKEMSIISLTITNIFI